MPFFFSSFFCTFFFVSFCPQPPSPFFSSQEESKGNKKNVTLIGEYIKKVEKELADICDEVIKLLKESLIPKADKAEGAEAKVFYHKM